MSCTIIIDNPGIYTLGSLVSGKVVCTFDNRENINGIRCKLRGEEKTYWTTGSGKNRRHHRGHFECVSGDITLFGAGEIGPGEYVYPFNFTLPTNGISSSYQHRYGSIRYFIYANVDKSFALDYKDEVTLHVEIPFDFNELEYTNTLRPVTYQAEKEIGGCFCPITFITMNMTLEKESFILGDVIKVKIDINNATDTTIYDVIVNLGSTIQLIAHSPQTKYYNDKTLLAVASTKAAVNAHSQGSFDLNLVIPETTLPTFFGNGLFKRWCSVEAEACISGFHTNLIMERVVKLSTVRIINNMNPTNNITNNPIPIGVAPTDLYPPGAPPYVGPSAPPEGLNMGQRTLGADSLPPSYNEVMKS